MKKLLIVLAVLVLSTLACAKLSPVLENIENNLPVDILPTAEVQPTDAVFPTEVVQVGAYFVDDFSNPDSGWDRVTEEHKSTDYANGAYRMWLDEDQYDIWANPGQYFSGPVSIEVDATLVNGENDNDFGIICNYQDTENFYYGLISSDGYAVVGKVQTGESTYLSSDQMQAADGINTGFATNHLRFDCVDGNMTLYANGNLVASAYDNSFSGGDVGLQVGTFDTNLAEFLFDNFIVQEP